jgi:hypothetical protein
MAKIFFDRTHAIPNKESRIIEVEKIIGTQLPKDYRAYLKANNGAVPRIEGYEERMVLVRLQWPVDEPAKAVGEIADLHDPQILAEDRDEQETFDIRWQIENDEGSVPTDTIVIWRDSGGDFFLLGIRKHNYGKVFFQARDYLRFDENDTVTNDAIAFVANSFTELIQMIEPEPDDWDAWEAAGMPHLPLESDTNP